MIHCTLFIMYLVLFNANPCKSNFSSFLFTHTDNYYLRLIICLMSFDFVWSARLGLKSAEVNYLRYLRKRCP